MKEKYIKEYNRFFEPALKGNKPIYSNLTKEINIDEDEAKKRMFKLEQIHIMFPEGPQHLIKIGESFTDEISTEYANVEMDLTEFYYVVITKALDAPDPKYEKARDEIRKIHYKTTSNFHVLEIIYNLYLKEDNLEKKTLGLLIDAIAEFEHSIIEMNFFKTIMFSRFLQEHFVHFIEERVSVLAKQSSVFEEVDVLMEVHRGRSLGVNRNSLPEIMDIFLKSNRHITGKFLAEQKINKLRDRSNNLWKISSYFLHAGDSFISNNFKLDGFKHSFDLIRLNGLKYIFDIVHYLFPILYKKEYKDVMHTLSSAPLEFRNIVKLDDRAIPFIYSKNHEHPTLKERNFRKKGLYKELDHDEVLRVSEEYNYPNNRVPTEESVHYYKRIFKYFEEKFNESDDLYEKTIILRRVAEVIMSNLTYYHEHYKHWDEIVVVKNQINGLFHIDYKEQEETNFSRLTPVNLEMENVQVLHSTLLLVYSHLEKEHEGFVRERREKREAKKQTE